MTSSSWNCGVPETNTRAKLPSLRDQLGRSAQLYQAANPDVQVPPTLSHSALAGWVFSDRFQVQFNQLVLFEFLGNGFAGQEEGR